MTAVPYWNAREHIGRYFSTLVLEDYDLPSLENIKTLFDDCLKNESPKKAFEKLNLIIGIFEAVESRLLHYIKLCDQSFSSAYFESDPYLAKCATTDFFKMLCGNYPLHISHTSYFTDLLSQTILFNDVKANRVIDCCDLLQKISIHLHEKRSIIHQMKNECCKSNCHDIEECNCDYFEKSKGGKGLDVVD